MDIDKKIRYQSKRGLLELDLILSDFILHESQKLSIDEKHVLLNLLTTDDMTLWDIFQKKQEPYEGHKNILSRIEMFTKNNRVAILEDDHEEK